MSNKLAILGGKPLRNKDFESRKTIRDNEINAVNKVLNRGILSDFLANPGNFFYGGDYVKKFEKKWSEKYNYKHSVTVNSATSALIAAVGAIGVSAGDEVICTPYSMSASATCVLFYGAIPIFIDIDRNNLAINTNLIEQKITSKTKAIIVVHLFGCPADMDKIVTIAKKYKLKIIEDCSQSPGATYKEKYVGTLGDIGCFSLNYHKHIHTGEGGILVTNNDEYALKLRLIRNHAEGAFTYYGLDDPLNMHGANFRLTELQAAIGIEQIKKIDNYLQHRRSLANHLDDIVEEFNFLETIYPKEYKVEHSYYLYPIRFIESNVGISRELFIKAINCELHDDSIEGTALYGGYVKPIYLMDYFQYQTDNNKRCFPFSYVDESNFIDNYKNGSCEVVESMYKKELIFTPLIRESITTNDIDDFKKVITKVYNQRECLKDL